ncbi:MAG: Gfo/Idh/MocA family oxidoreductase [Pseudomonadota bacterium]
MMNTQKKVLVCGLGSMGKRRIQILLSEYPDIELCGVDFRYDRVLETKEKYGIKVDTDFEKTFHTFKPHAVFACSPPLTHSGIVVFALENKVNTFSEINLNTNGYEKIIHLSKKNETIAFLSSTFLYRKEILWLINKIKANKKVSYRYHVGQYLPDWHPWEKYTDFFVADKQTNAIREIMAIEFPWMFKAFGKVVEYHVIKGRVSKLDFGYPDMFHLIFKHETGIMGSICIDCVSVKATRKLEVYSDEIFYQWGGAPDNLETYSAEHKKMIPVSLYDAVRQNNQYNEFIIENPYAEEIKDFFSMVQNRPRSLRFSYEDDMDVIELIDNIETCT